VDIDVWFIFVVSGIGLTGPNAMALAMSKVLELELRVRLWEVCSLHVVY
jgi:hypothetical protein